MLYIKREWDAKRLIFFADYKLTLHEIYVPVIGIYTLDFAIEYVIRVKYYLNLSFCGMLCLETGVRSVETCYVHQV